MSTLTDKQAKLLTDANLAVVATIREDGTPQLSTTWVDWDGEHVLFNTREGRAKPANLRRDPRASVFVQDPNDSYNWVAITGSAELTSEGAADHIDALSLKYTGEHYEDKSERLVVRVAPERVTSSG